MRRQASACKPCEHSQFSYRVRLLEVLHAYSPNLSQIYHNHPNCLLRLLHLAFLDAGDGWIGALAR